MKKFVKAITGVCLVLCCALILTACGGGVQGTYETYSLTILAGEKTVTVTVNEYEELLEKQATGAELTDEEGTKISIGQKFLAFKQTLTLEVGGVAKLSIKDQDGEVVQEREGTYTLEGEVLSVVYGDEPAQTATCKDGQIIIQTSSPMGDMVLVFKK